MCHVILCNILSATFLCHEIRLNYYIEGVAGLNLFLSMFAFASKKWCVEYDRHSSTSHSFMSQNYGVFIKWTVSLIWPYLPLNMHSDIFQ